MEEPIMQCVNNLYIYCPTCMPSTVVRIVVRGGSNVKEGKWDAIYYV